MVDFYTGKIPQSWYYSNFFPDRHFTSQEDAIEFEKSMGMAHLPQVASFYQRNLDEEPARWTVDSNDNYQTPTYTPGFTQIPYTYKVKKTFVTIEEDEISYYYFNEDTMQYELLETINNNTGEDEYQHNLFFSDPACMNKIDGYYEFGPYNNYKLVIKDCAGLIENLTDGVLYYAKQEKLYYWKNIEETSAESGSESHPDAWNNYIQTVVYDEDKKYTTINGSEVVVSDTITDFDSEKSVQNKYYYFKQENILLKYESDDWTQVFESDAALYLKTSTNVEGYLDIDLEATDDDKWYVRICRNVYSVFSWIWRGIVKIGQAIGSFFKNLWSYLKGETYYGTEITFYWGTNIVEVSSKSILDSITKIISENKIFQSLENPRYYWAYQNGSWTKNNLAKWKTPFKTTGHEEQIVSRYKDLKTRSGSIYYVTQTQKIYYKVNGEFQPCATISDAAMEIYKQGSTTYKNLIYYCQKEKQCYKLINNIWTLDNEHSSINGLYEVADALRLVLDYKDYISNKNSIKDFNSIIQKLNEELGFNFPTNVNTVQPTAAEEGDWGFYYFDKVKGWMSGKEAYELEVL